MNEVQQEHESTAVRHPLVFSARAGADAMDPS